MSLLAPEQQSSPELTPEQIAIQRDQDATRRAQKVLRLPAQMIERQITEWEGGINQIWGSDHPEDVLEKLDTHAQELFALSSFNAEFLLAQCPADSTNPGILAYRTRIISALALVPSARLQYQSDGRVTLAPLG